MRQTAGTWLVAATTVGAASLGATRLCDHSAPEEWADQLGLSELGPPLATELEANRRHLNESRMKVIDAATVTVPRLNRYFSVAAPPDVRPG